MQGNLGPIDPFDARQLEITVKRLANSLSYGTDHSPFLGPGVEYVQSRAYQPGDPVRVIDWRVTARTGRFHVKEYESPKRMPVYLFVDTSASMTISSTHLSKYAVAVQIAGGLALACLDRVSPVGLVGTGSRDLLIQPSLSKNQILQWLSLLRRFRYDENTTLGRRIQEITPTLRHRALIIILSDLHDADALPALKRMASLHDCAVIQLRDPAEKQLTGSGLLRAREAETGREFVTHGRRQFVDSALIEETFKKSGIDHLQIDTNRPYQENLRRFFLHRGLLGRGSR